MEKILTKEEIDALLSSIMEGKIDPDRELARAGGEAVACDLFNTEHKGFVPNLDIIYDSFIRYNRVTLSNRLRKMVEIKKIGARAYKFDDFLTTLPSPVCMGLFKIDPLKGAALMAMDSNFVFTVVDSILGGAGSPTAPGKNRMFTSIELKIMQKVVLDALVDLQKAWTPLLATNMSLIRMEMNPRLVNIVPPEYQIVNMELEIQIEEVSGNITFAIPYMTIDPIREKLKAGVQLDMMAVDAQWSTRLSAELYSAPVELSVELGETQITLQDLLNLKPGDTIMLDNDCDSDLVVKLAGVPKYVGVPGVRGGNKAVQLTAIKEKE